MAYLISLVSLLLAATTTLVNANTGVPEDWFRNQQLRAAEAAAPMWHMASGSCLPSAGENGRGGQTDGINVPVVMCAINQDQSGGCADSTWRGSGNVEYRGTNEPFDRIPTYYKIQYCGFDDSFRIGYFVYFKKDVSHKSDWEWAIIRYKRQSSGSSTWIRNGLFMEVDGNYQTNNWGGTDTFWDRNDIFNDGQRGRNYPKLYFGKRSHSVHTDKEGRNKNSCVKPDFRANDFYFWARDHLRHESVINPGWSYGQASNPRGVDICDNKGANIP